MSEEAFQGGEELASGQSCPLNGKVLGSRLLGVTVELFGCSSDLILSPQAGTTAEGRHPAL